MEFAYLPRKKLNQSTIMIVKRRSINRKEELHMSEEKMIQILGRPQREGTGAPRVCCEWTTGMSAILIEG